MDRIRRQDESLASILEDDDSEDDNHDYLKQPHELLAIWLCDRSFLIHQI